VVDTRDDDVGYLGQFDVQFHGRSMGPKGYRVKGRMNDYLI
jgi:hypothetical protein